MKINSIILSAGKGTRMQSDLPKVVQKVAGYEMINLVLKSLNEAGIENNNLVVGYKKETVVNSIDKKFEFNFVEQKDQLGTGHAVLMMKEHLKESDGITVVTCGDTPLIKAKTFKKLIKKHKGSHNDLTILTTKLKNPNGYGRIIRNDVDQVTAIVEQKDADENTLLINEINTGIYCFNNKLLFEYIEEIKNTNNQNEYYLTDIVDIFNKNNRIVSCYQTSDADEVIGINDLVALSQASKILQLRINNEHLLNGVNIIDPSNTYIGPNVSIGKGTIIEPNNHLIGECEIGSNVLLKSNNTIDNSNVDDNCLVGPSATIRDKTKISKNCRIGNFVEIKNSNIGEGNKAAHLTYIGDANTGCNVNFGCGSITANYDGKNKSITSIGSNVFVGSNVNLIAPLIIKDDVFIAAGSTVTHDVDENKFVISREKQRVKERLEK